MPNWSIKADIHTISEYRAEIFLLSELRCSYTAISHEQQYNQFFILVYELELQFVKRTNKQKKRKKLNWSLWANMRAYEWYRLSQARHILVQITSVIVVTLYMRTKKQFFSWITTIFVLFSEGSQFRTVVTCPASTLRSFHVMWTQSDVGITALLKSVTTYRKSP